MKQNNIPNNNTVRITVAVLIVIHFFSSCYTQKKAVKDLHKAHQNYPDTVAALTRAWFPCITTASDTISKIDTLYDFIQLECPEYDINEPKSGKVDTIYKDKPPVNFLIPTRSPAGTRPVIVGLNKYPTTKYITQKVEDSAKIFLMQRQVSDYQATVVERDATIKEVKKHRTWFLILLIISLAFNIIQRITRKR